MRPPADAKITTSGLTMSVLRAGTGARPPHLSDTVVVHFTGWDQDGERFDSSIIRGKPDRLRVEALIPGWREAIQDMVVGEKRRLWLPERLAFGSVPTPGRPAGDIVLEVELLEVIEAPALPSAPDNLNAVPSDAHPTKSGLRSQVISAGQGQQRPVPDDRVVVHYSGWTLDGTLFDSSIPRGEPAVFGVSDVIPGWTEALQLMVVGEKRRVWIPAALAYGETPARPGAPSGDLVFDIELVEIEGGDSQPGDGEQ
jgi:peptidylprolyl isomerase